MVSTNCESRDLLNFDFLEKGLGLVLQTQFLDNCLKKTLLMLYSINWPNFISRLPLLLHYERNQNKNLITVKIAFTIFKVYHLVGSFVIFIYEPWNSFMCIINAEIEFPAIKHPEKTTIIKLDVTKVFWRYICLSVLLKSREPVLISSTFSLLLLVM